MILVSPPITTVSRSVYILIFREVLSLEGRFQQNWVPSSMYSDIYAVVAKCFENSLFEPRHNILYVNVNAVYWRNISDLL
jgi:hypothetical protein